MVEVLVNPNGAVKVLSCLPKARHDMSQTGQVRAIDKSTREVYFLHHTGSRVFAVSRDMDAAIMRRAESALRKLKANSIRFESKLIAQAQTVIAHAMLK